MTMPKGPLMSSLLLPVETPTAPTRARAKPGQPARTEASSSAAATRTQRRRTTAWLAVVAAAGRRPTWTTERVGETTCTVSPVCSARERLRRQGYAAPMSASVCMRVISLGPTQEHVPQSRCSPAGATIAPCSRSQRATGPSTGSWPTRHQSGPSVQASGLVWFADWTKAFINVQRQTRW